MDTAELIVDTVCARGGDYFYEKEIIQPKLKPFALAQRLETMGMA
mgnify:CR=1 FL=1|jgi:hypothetical protein